MKLFENDPTIFYIHPSYAQLINLRITSEVAGLSTTHTQNPTLDWQQHLPASFFNGHVGPVAS